MSKRDGYMSMGETKEDLQHALDEEILINSRSAERECAILAELDRNKRELAKCKLVINQLLLCISLEDYKALAEQARELQGVD